MELDRKPDNIALIDLAAQQQRIRGKIEKRINAVLSHGNYIMGPEIAELEKRLSAFSGARHAISCASGTDALLMALMAYGIGPGDAILTTPFTFIATAETIALLGATPVFVDIDPTTFNMDPEKLEKTIDAVNGGNTASMPLPRAEKHTPPALRPKGVIAVDLFGLPADYNAISAVAKKQGLFVIEDAAQSFGASYHGGKAGNLADVAATSFFPAKPLGCYGDGGAVFTNDDALAGIMQSVRLHGKGSDKYDNVRIGINGRLDTIQAAILLEKLDIFEDEIKARNHVAATYTSFLEKKVRVPRVPEHCLSVWAQYSIIHEERERIQTALKNAGIPSAIYYPKPLHLQTAFSYLGYREGDFPVSEATSRNIFSLPMHPYLTDEQIQVICTAIESALR